MASRNTTFLHHIKYGAGLKTKDVLGTTGKMPRRNPSNPCHIKNYMALSYKFLSISDKSMPPAKEVMGKWELPWRYHIKTDSMSLKLNHKAKRTHDVFGFTPQEFARMHAEMVKLNEICVSDFESIQHAYNKSTDDRTRAAYLYIMFYITTHVTVRHRPKKNEKK